MSLVRAVQRGTWTWLQRKFKFAAAHAGLAVAAQVATNQITTEDQQTIVVVPQPPQTPPPPPSQLHLSEVIVITTVVVLALIAIAGVLQNLWRNRKHFYNSNDIELAQRRVSAPPPTPEGRR